MEWGGVGRAEGPGIGPALTDLLEQETLGPVLRFPAKGTRSRRRAGGTAQRAQPGALTPKTHHSPLGSLNSGSVFRWRVSGGVGWGMTLEFFWSELKVERKKEVKHEEKRRR